LTFHIAKYYIITVKLNKGYQMPASSIRPTARAESMVRYLLNADATKTHEEVKLSEFQPCICGDSHKVGRVLPICCKVKVRALANDIGVYLTDVVRLTGVHSCAITRKQTNKIKENHYD